MFANLRVADSDLDRAELLTTEDSAKGLIIWSFKVILGNTKYSCSVQKKLANCDVALCSKRPFNTGMWSENLLALTS